MRISKSTLKKIIREEASRLIEEIQPDGAAADAGSASVQDLKDWFLEKRQTVRDLKVPPNQIRALIDAMDDAILAAQEGKLRAKGKYLATVMDKISGVEE